MSVRQQIVDAIETRLSLIAANYQFTLRDGAYTCGTTVKDVYPWRKVPFSPAQTPCIAFYDTEDQIEPATNKDAEHSLKIDIEGYLTGSTSITAARVLMADIFAAVESDRRWGGLARWTDIVAGDPVLNQAADVCAAVQVSLIVVYRTGYGRL